MKYTLILTLLAIIVVNGVNAQLGGINRINNKVNSRAAQRVDHQVDKTIDAALDAAEGKGSTPSNGTNAQKSTGDKSQPAPVDGGNNPIDKSVTSYSKFDFVPGNTVVYADDFSKDETGQLPLHWNTQGKGEVVTIDKKDGNWLRLFPTAVYLPGSKSAFTKNFTVEFDLLLDMRNNGYTYPYFSFGLLSSGSQDAADNRFLDGYRSIQSAEIYIRLSSGGSTGTYIESFEGGKKQFQSETQQLSNLENYYGKTSHVCIQVQETRLRVWFNGEKKFDLPRALPVSGIFNNLFFKTFSSSYKEEQLGFYISNIRVSAGLADARNKILEEGKFSTTGILFDFNAATIKPESTGVLKEIADILTKNSSVSLSIVGHTDNDGAEAVNLELSRKRSLAVKSALVTVYNIDESRLKTDGRGESEPVADNKTREGRAANRRVDFIKL